ncbi:hypothetical protein HKO22_03120 [Peptoniphilus sp. AGMB00490]|uniref:Tetrahydrofolate dehydrogenase/cyclohydrolase NAD(P)-binding domain-containing protein n=1 Tax=Peptoniphilus faecalis TaxID=2731255 RepID=A0A848RHK9_9FIRM|nr:hypothetical protein [Peptoniphilus faecalis]NMW84736.1 hypothetical protein [Peptoniphilus faecalis]
MTSLLVIYDSSISDKGRDLYLKGIKKAVPDVKIKDAKVGIDGIQFDADKVIVLRPMNYKHYCYFMYQLRANYPEKDIEGVATGSLTITAEALLETIYDYYNSNIANKTVVVINQSPTVGIPLVKALIDCSLNVINLNSSYPCIDSLLANTKVDILISASGNKNFQISEALTRDIEMKIDLSNDLLDTDKITSIPTIRVLEDRLTFCEVEDEIEQQ